MSNDERLSAAGGAAGKAQNGSVFAHVEQAAPDSVFNVAALFRQDKHPKKVNLSVGGKQRAASRLSYSYPVSTSLPAAYRNEDGVPWVLPVVRTVEAQMSTDPMLDHEYLPLDGMKAFTEGAAKFLLGKDSPAVTQDRVRRVEQQTRMRTTLTAAQHVSMYMYCVFSGLLFVLLYKFFLLALLPSHLFSLSLGSQYCAVQAISGTGSLRLSMEFLHRYLNCNTVYLSKPTWGECTCVTYIVKILG